jgi:hypothetical protein
MRAKNQTIAAAATTAGIAGAALMYFLDSNSGARRRAGLRDKIVHFSRLGGKAASVTGRDAVHRLEGAWAEASHLLKEEPVDNDVLRERVRSQLGRSTSRPGPIEVAVKNGNVLLRGSVIDEERAGLVRSIQKVRGVQSVVDQLVADKGSGRMTLPGRTPRIHRGEFMQSNWAPAIRAIAILAGAGAIGYGAARRDMIGVALAVLGLPAVVRAITNQEFTRLAGIETERRAA